MRNRILFGFVCLFVLTAPLAAATARTGSMPTTLVSGGLAIAVNQVTAASAFQAQAKDVKIDIDVHASGGRWHVKPVWIAIGVIGLVVLVLLVAMAIRGGGTTVVK